MKDLINDIKNNTISEISAKKGLNALIEIKNAEIIKFKRPTHKQKELLNLFNQLLDTILTDKTLKQKSQKDDNNENENENDKTLMSPKDDENENDKTLISSNEDNENENDKTLISSNEDNENENENETVNKKNKDIIIKELNEILDEIIGKSKSFEEQIKSIKK